MIMAFMIMIMAKGDLRASIRLHENLRRTRTTHSRYWLALVEEEDDAKGRAEAAPGTSKGKKAERKNTAEDNK